MTKVKFFLSSVCALLLASSAIASTATTSELKNEAQLKSSCTSGLIHIGPGHYICAG